MRGRAMISYEHNRYGEPVLRRQQAVQDSREMSVTYTYDGKNRLLSGEGDSYTYDELSNIVTRGSDKTYTYQQSGVGDQMRLASFNDGTTTYTYEYDDDDQSQSGQGNVTAITSKLDDLKYDDLNRLGEVTHPDDQVDPRCEQDR